MAAFIALPSILQRILQRWQVLEGWGLILSSQLMRAENSEDEMRCECVSVQIQWKKLVFPEEVDPVYGKGKLGEIQGLILGMLDTFNYEQTLLETTTSLLNQDLHWSLCNLRASVTRGLNPKQDYCSICLQQYKRRQEMADEIIVFR
ncbi:Vacuolar protein sorting-associated protein 8 [Saguinus oedipus]|uniref:Vacuolar protein sorting-associated protein 8 n=1 Tax=Saguinus oedipus TaxID=9490 RepID=A0ABQ9U182_SAGOE|nr:Vacuolar protein sorting-associated protein 8 [Saguinus oedipus]